MDTITTKQDGKSVTWTIDPDYTEEDHRVAQRWFLEDGTEQTLGLGIARRKRWRAEGYNKLADGEESGFSLFNPLSWF